MPTLDPYRMSPNESFSLSIDGGDYFLDSGETISNPSCTLEDSDGNDVSSTNLTGSASVSNDVVTSPVITGLTAGNDYTLIYTFDVGNSTAEYKRPIYCRS